MAPKYVHGEGKGREKHPVTIASLINECITTSKRGARAPEAEAMLWAGNQTAPALPSPGEEFPPVPAGMWPTLSFRRLPSRWGICLSEPHGNTPQPPPPRSELSSGLGAQSPPSPGVWGRGRSEQSEKTPPLPSSCSALDRHLPTHRRGMGTSATAAGTAVAPVLARIWRSASRWDLIFFPSPLPYNHLCKNKTRISQEVPVTSCRQSPPAATSWG